jgi:hypothetical protein
MKSDDVEEELIDTLGRKPREAQYNLDKMRKLEALAFGDKEPFDHHLSAFLNAGVSVQKGFRVEQDRARNDAVRAWRESWEESLTDDESRLYDFMRKDRVAEVHRSGSQRSTKVEEIPIPGSYSDASGTVEVFSAPATLGYSSSPAVIRKPAYFFTIDGAERKVTDACADYLALLGRAVGQFKTDRPLAPTDAPTDQDSGTALLATGRYLGEGFDDARLDTLFL